MASDLDLRELAIDRGGADQASRHTRRHLLTRYVLPLMLMLGFLFLVAWACRDLMFPPQPVTVVPVFATNSEVQQAGTTLFQAAGWIEPRPTPVRVAALAPGVVEQLLVVEDQPVKAGEPIAELVKDDAKLASDRAAAELALRQAELDQAKALLRAAEMHFEQPVHLEAALGEAEAALARIETQLKNLPFEIRRAVADSEAMQKEYQGKLAAQGVVAGVEINNAKGKLDAAKAFVEGLRERSKSLTKERAALVQRRDAVQTQFELRADETRAKEEAAAMVKARAARVAQARVDVDEARLQCDRMTVRSPMDGRVFRLFAHPGARVGSGSTQTADHDSSTVVTLYRPGMLQVRVDVRFEDIPQVSLNQLVKIGNPALALPLTGKVLFVSSEADIQKNTLQVKVEISDPPAVLKPEMLVDVAFLAAERSGQAGASSQELKIYVLPQLIHSDASGSFVWLADQSDGIARKKMVETGVVASNGLVEVTRGLTPASRVIVGSADSLQDGGRIKVTGEDGSLGTTNDFRQGGRSPVTRPPTGKGR
jgi:multidrug efflux pump subunit AcrA (membrane-fusion protein)